MRERRLKKRIALLALAMAMVLCGCSQSSGNSSGETTANSEDGIEIVVDPDTANNDQDQGEGSLIERKKQQEVSAPEKSISFEEACELLDSCDMESLYLPQPAKDYKKEYFGTVKHDHMDFYSIYLYIENGKEKIYVGTNYIVSCDGKYVMKKTWTAEYYNVETKTASADLAPEELYQGAKIMPNDALKILCDKDGTKLKLGEDTSIYTFEVSTKVVDVDSFECYKITPKLDFTNNLEILEPFYVNIDGTGEVYVKDSASKEYQAVK